MAVIGCVVFGDDDDGLGWELLGADSAAAGNADGPFLFEGDRWPGLPGRLTASFPGVLCAGQEDRWRVIICTTTGCSFRRGVCLWRNLRRRIAGGDGGTQEMEGDRIEVGRQPKQRARRNR